MSAEVITRVEGRTGWISLNRPRAIHALTLDMCQAMLDALAAWEGDDGVDAVILDHAVDPGGDPKLSRGFCAGGDVVTLRDSGMGDGVAGRHFFHVEYQLNHLMFTYAKPIVAFMDGIVMGGGAGIALPARYRVATENTRFAMPETAIGLFPDVGGGWFLPRLPGRTGVFLALTGARIDGAECMALGLATHYLPADSLTDVKARIAADPAAMAAILDAAATPPPPARITGNRDAIDRLFASDRYADILAALTADGGEWAQKELATLSSKSPTSCMVTLRQLALGGAMSDFADNMAMEYQLGAHMLHHPDFLEGVRALLVDKSHDALWSPPSADAITDAMIDALFAPHPDAGTWHPLRPAA